MNVRVLLNDHIHVKPGYLLQCNEFSVLRRHLIMCPWMSSYQEGRAGVLVPSW